jgi:hypothetical protein
MIWVDGLDEYEGSDAQRQNLVDLLVRIAQHENVKVCVSSRPWPIFEGAFAAYPSLSLEALTRGDVATYVRDHFNKNANFVALSKIKPTQCSNLELQIVERASGVFLWVYLVVRDMLQRLQAGASISTLFKRLDLLPRELDDFFLANHRIYRHLGAGRRSQNIPPCYGAAEVGNQVIHLVLHRRRQRGFCATSRAGRPLPSSHRTSAVDHEATSCKQV